MTSRLSQDRCDRPANNDTFRPGERREDLIARRLRLARGNIIVHRDTQDGAVAFVMFHLQGQAAAWDAGLEGAFEGGDVDQLAADFDEVVGATEDADFASAQLREVAGAHPTDIVSGPQLEPVKARLAHIVPRCLPIPERKGRRVVVLVGPPGSGKTTVAASLAGRCVRRGRQPGLISLDTFRAGGQAGLGQYARALEVPFASVFEATDLLAVAQGDLASCDLLIVDTPGLTLVEREAVRLIRDVQLSLREPEVHAVLAADSKVAEAAESLNLLGNFKLSSLIFTRLDVTKSFGGMLSLSLKTKLPVSHGHWGRRVLEDFRDASPEELISLVLDQCTAGWEETVR